MQETPAGSESMARQKQRHQGTWEIHLGPKAKAWGMQDRGTSKEMQMPGWKSDSLIVLGVQESCAHGEATSGMYLDGETCILLREEKN